MLQRAIVLVVAPVAMLCACASRQSTGDLLRTQNFILAPVYAVPHGQMFSMTAAALNAEGYVVARRDSAEEEGWLETAPQFTAPSCFKPEVRGEVEQLGLGRVVTARTTRRHDSTRVDILSRVVRRNAIANSQRGRADELDGMLRVCGSGMVLIRLDSLAGPKRERLGQRNAG